ncbi:hypothetical protein [Methanolobus psychrotolerans]|uniref:hypothetical protein n=1 Tax=Methanolobus psychrotolerans TaxID=1874706 RepID=UPI0013EA9417|nr:hypothetical protein [Methanolobus psychrotolerans]
MNKHCDVYTGEQYQCPNCGFAMEVVNPCHSCGEGEVRCPFCGEQMAKKWQ